MTGAVNRDRVGVGDRTANADVKYKGRPLSDGACLVRLSSSGRPPVRAAAHEESRYLATRGDTLSNRASAYGSRPPRSFPQEAVLLPFRTMLPLEEMNRAGAVSVPGIGSDLNAPPKAGVGVQRPGQRPLAGAGAASGTASGTVNRGSVHVSEPRPFPGPRQRRPPEPMVTRT